MLSGTINVDGMTAGPHTATISFDLDSDYKIAKATVTFTLKEKPNGDDPDNSDNQGDSENDGNTTE